MNKRFVVVAGNIGVGKSTLVEMLSRRLGWEPFFEPVGENPYLVDFYGDMRAWAFQSQVFFLTRRLQAHLNLWDHPTSAIQDRSIYEDAEVFARNLFLQGHLSERDMNTYNELYRAIMQLLPAPDLILYLKASVETLQHRIAQRGREYERRIPSAYLAQLNDLYVAWIEGFSLCPILTVPADDLDYVAHTTHLDLIVSKVNDKLSGKEIVRFEEEEVARAKAADR